MSGFLQYYWDVFCLAFQGAWAITEVIAGVIAIIGGFIVWKRPGWESTMKNLLWMIPVGIFTLLLLIRLAIAPYTIHQNQQQQIIELQKREEVAMTSKQDIRSFLESINPEILKKIDVGQKEIRIFIGKPNAMKLVDFSTYPNFYKFLFFQQSDDKTFPDLPKDGFINQLDANEVWLYGYYLYPRDAIKK